MKSSNSDIAKAFREGWRRGYRHAINESFYRTSQMMKIVAEEWSSDEWIKRKSVMEAEKWNKNSQRSV